MASISDTAIAQPDSSGGGSGSQALASKRKGSEGVEVEVRALSEYFKSPKMVKIYVGPTRTPFYVHKELICDKIDFFRTAFTGGFKETQEQEISMPEDNPTTFGYLVEYIYTGSVGCQKCLNHPRVSDHLLSSDPDGKLAAETKSSDATNSAEEICNGEVEGARAKEFIVDPEHELQWCRLYVLADKLGMDRLQTEAVRQYENCLIDFGLDVSPEAVSYVYANTAESTENPSRMTIALLDYTVGAFFNRDEVPKHVHEAMAANGTFGFEVIRCMKKHMMLESSPCLNYRCRLHARGPFCGKGGSLYQKWVTKGWTAGRKNQQNPSETHRN